METERFISEPIQPVEGTFDPTGMTRGEPGLPRRFTWRDDEYAVTEVLEAWKEDGPCKSGSRAMSGSMFLACQSCSPSSCWRRSMRAGFCRWPSS